MLFSRKLDSPAKAREQEVQPGHAPALAPPRNLPSIAAGGSAASQSFVDAPLTIVGDLHTAGDVRIDGRICGTVHCAQLILGRDAVVTGSIVAAEAVLRGTVIGTIRAPVVIIQDTAHVESEITYRSLSMDEGAFFEGSAHRRDNPLDEPEQKAPPAEPAARAIETPPAGGAMSGDGATKATVQPTATANGKEPRPGNDAPRPNGYSAGG